MVAAAIARTASAAIVAGEVLRGIGDTAVIFDIESFLSLTARIPESRPCRGARYHSGLTGGGSPLYSTGFATLACRLTEGLCGGTGRRARLIFEFRKECWFDSGQGHDASPSAMRGAAYLSRSEACP